MDVRSEEGPEPGPRAATRLPVFDRLALLATGVVACVVLFQLAGICQEIARRSPGLGHLFPWGSREARVEGPPPPPPTVPLDAPGEGP